MTCNIMMLAVGQFVILKGKTWAVPNVVYMYPSKYLYYSIPGKTQNIYDAHASNIIASNTVAIVIDVDDIAYDAHAIETAAAKVITACGSIGWVSIDIVMII